MTRTLVFLGFALLAACGGEKNRDDDKDQAQANLTPDQGDQGPAGPQGEPGATGPRGGKGPGGKDGVDGTSGADGQDYQYALNGDYAGETMQLQLAATSYKKFYAVGDGFLLESGISTSFDGQLFFQPKVYQCITDEGVTSITDRDITAHVDAYKHRLIAKEGDNLVALQIEQTELPATIAAKETDVAAQVLVVDARAEAVRGAESTVSGVTAKINDLRDHHMQPLQQKVAEAGKQKGHYADELSLVEERKVALTQSIDSTLNGIAERETAITKGERAINALTAERALNRQHIDIAAATLVNAQQEHDALTNAISVKKEEIALADDDDLRVRLEAELSDLEMALEGVSANVVNLEKEVQDLEHKEAALVANIEKKALVLEADRNAHAQLSAKLTEDRQLLAAANDRATDLTQAIAGLDKLLAELNTQYEALVAREAGLQAQLEKVSADLEAAREMLAQEEVTLQTLREDLTSAMARRDAMDELIDSQTRYIEQLVQTEPFKPTDSVVGYELSDDKLILTAESETTEFVRMSEPEDRAKIGCDAAMDLLFGSPRAN